MTRWCLYLDRPLNENECYNKGCTDEWGTYHSCKGCPHNRYMGDSNINCLTNNKRTIKEKVEAFKVQCRCLEHNAEMLVGENYDIEPVIKMSNYGNN